MWWALWAYERPALKRWILLRIGRSGRVDEGQTGDSEALQRLGFRLNHLLAERGQA